MAELVDALVSNTSGVKPVPVRSRLRVQKGLLTAVLFLYLNFFTPGFAGPSRGIAALRAGR